VTDDSFPEFAWAVGEEGSDPLVSVDGKPFRHDQFAQSGHYDHLVHDLRSVASLGVGIVRYGMPWRLSEPEAGRYDWTLWDRALGACDDAGVEPIIDLLHFGLPDHYSGFADRAWVDGFRRYVDAFLGRYREPRWFTPVNEPGITALLSARFGMWNDQLSNETDHARVLANIVLANLEAIARIRADRNGWWIGAEGFDVPVAARPDDESDVERRRALGWLVWDLHLGREPIPAAAAYLDAVDEAVLDRIASLAVSDALIAGHDFYPTGIQYIGGTAPMLTVAQRTALGVDELRRWHDRYRLPFWVAETSNLSLPVSDQVPWLESLVDGLHLLRAEGRPARGICWYSRGDQYDWQTALATPTGAVTEVGLFDVERRPRAVAAAFARLAAGAPN
jgi:beta-glucosidase